MRKQNTHPNEYAYIYLLSAWNKHEEKMHFETSKKQHVVVLEFIYWVNFWDLNTSVFMRKCEFNVEIHRATSFRPSCFSLTDLHLLPPCWATASPHHITSHDIKSSSFTPSSSGSLHANSFPLSLLPTLVSATLLFTSWAHVRVARSNRSIQQSEEWKKNNRTCETHQLKIYMQKYTPHSLFYKMINYDWAIYIQNIICMTVCS